MKINRLLQWLIHNDYIKRQQLQLKHGQEIFYGTPDSSNCYSISKLKWDLMTKKNQPLFSYRRLCHQLINVIHALTTLSMIMQKVLKRYTHELRHFLNWYKFPCIIKITFWYYRWCCVDSLIYMPADYRNTGLSIGEKRRRLYISSKPNVFHLQERFATVYQWYMHIVSIKNFFGEQCIFCFVLNHFILYCILNSFIIYRHARWHYSHFWYFSTILYALIKICCTNIWFIINI